MSKTNTFASFANAAERPQVATEPELILADSSITVEELLEALQEMIKENPSIAKAHFLMGQGPFVKKVTQVISAKDVILLKG